MNKWLMFQERVEKMVEGAGEAHATGMYQHWLTPRHLSVKSAPINLFNVLVFKPINFRAIVGGCLILGIGGLYMSTQSGAGWWWGEREVSFGLGWGELRLSLTERRAGISLFIYLDWATPVTATRAWGFQQQHSTHQVLPTSIYEHFISSHNYLSENVILSRTPTNVSFQPFLSPLESREGTTWHNLLSQKSLKPFVSIC